MIERDQACELLREMVRIPSFSGNEGNLALFLADRLSAWGFATSVDSVGNLIAETGSAEGPLVILMGHTDTVCSFLPVYEADGILHGRGTVDAKGPLATFICAAANARHLPVRLIVIGAVEEESGSAGAIALRQRYQPDALFIGEPSGVQGVVIGYKGQIKGRFAATEAAGHSAGPTGNALAQVVEFWNALKQRCAAWSLDQSAFDAVTPHLAAIHGTPEHAQLLFDIRLPVDFEMAQLIDETSAWQTGGTLGFSNYMSPALHSKNSLPARALRSAIREAGLEPKIKIKTGTSDMNTVSGYWNAPCVAYGPGNSKLDHTVHEHIHLDEYWSSIEILQSALVRLSAELSPSLTQ